MRVCHQHLNELRQRLTHAPVELTVDVLLEIMLQNVDEVLSPVPGFIRLPNIKLDAIGLALSAVEFLIVVDPVLHGHSDEFPHLEPVFLSELRSVDGTLSVNSGRSPTFPAPN